jgi:sugar phosphate isomerase/epimerase
LLDATGDLAPHRLGETGRRELRHVLRTVELQLVAVGLPTRRPFDTTEELDARMRRADAAFAMAYDLGTRLVVLRAGQIPAEGSDRLGIFMNALSSLARQADHRGVRLALETGGETGTALRGLLEAIAHPSLAASLDPSALLRAGIDPIGATRELGSWVAHAYAPSAARSASLGSRGGGMGSGALDWDEYLGALEEIGYGGFLTIWPDPAEDVRTQFTAIATRLKSVP